MREQYSYSKISTYIQCPYKYKKQYVDKVPQKLTWQLALGITTADILERIHKDTCEITDAYLKHLIFEYWIPNQYKKEFESQTKLTFQFLGYKDLTSELTEQDNLLKWLQFYFQKYTSKKSFGVEVSFEVDFDDYILNGRIDKIEKVDDCLYIIDNKVTSKFLNDLFESMQLGIYDYAISKMIPRFTVSKVGYYYVKQGKETLIDSSLLKKDLIYEKIRNAVTGIRESKFKPSGNIYCGWCDFKKECAV